MALQVVTTLCLTLFLLALVVDGATRAPPPKRSPPRKSPPRSPPPRKSPPPKRSPPKTPPPRKSPPRPRPRSPPPPPPSPPPSPPPPSPPPSPPPPSPPPPSPPPPSPPPSPPPTCDNPPSQLCDEFYKAPDWNTTGACLPVVNGCFYGAPVNCNTGKCVCPSDNVGPLMTGDTCGSCRPGQDPSTFCQTSQDPCLAYTFYSFSPLNYTWGPNQTIAQECTAINPDYICISDTTATPSTYGCACPKGFVDVDGSCVDVDDCLDFNQCQYTSTSIVIDDASVVPAYGAVCVNLPGTYNCTCPPCYTPTALNDEGIVSNCDPLLECSLTRQATFCPFDLTVNGTEATGNFFYKDPMSDFSC